MISILLAVALTQATPKHDIPPQLPHHHTFAPDAANQKFAAVNAAREHKKAAKRKPVTKLGGKK